LLEVEVLSEEGVTLLVVGVGLDEAIGVALEEVFSNKSQLDSRATIRVLLKTNPTCLKECLFIFFPY
jgi:hypothetical protein